MARQISTSVSDGVLAVVTLQVAWQVTTYSLTAALGFLIIGAAASCGTMRFAHSQPSTALVEKHTYLSWLGQVAGLPCIAVATHRLNGVGWVANVHMATALAVVFLHSRVLSDKALHITTEIVGTGAVLSVLLLNVLTTNMFGILGTLMYAFSGLVIKTTGNWIGIPRVDLFHYALAVANVALMMGLQPRREPIYYTPSG